MEGAEARFLSDATGLRIAEALEALARPQIAVHGDAAVQTMISARERAALMAELEACETRACELREEAEHGSGRDADHERLIAEEADAFDARADEIVLALTGCRRALSSRDEVTAI